jgi:plastocyanin
MQTQAAARVRGARAERRFGWASVLALGAWMMLLAPVIPQLAEGFEPFFAILMAPVLVGLVLLRLVPKVGTVWLGVVSVALLVMNAGFIPDALMHPESPTDFVPVSMLTVGGVVAVISTPGAFRAARGRRTDSGVPAIVGRAALIVLAAGAALSLVASSRITSDAPAAGSTAVTLENFAFAPGNVTVGRGPVALYLTNNDTARHTFTVDELGVDVSLAPGQSRLVTFDASAGEYRVYCKPHDPGMDGRLIVR